MEKHSYSSALMGGLRVENVMVSIDEKPVDRRIIGHSVKYLPQGRLIPEGMKLHRAFDLYGVNYWSFVNRTPRLSPQSFQEECQHQRG